ADLRPAHRCRRNHPRQRRRRHAGIGRGRHETPFRTSRRLRRIREISARARPRVLSRLTATRSGRRMNALGRSIHVRGKGCAHDHDRFAQRDPSSSFSLVRTQARERGARMPGTSDPYAAFRLNLEQQRKRAKDLLRAVRAGDEAARRRLANAVALPVPDAVTIKLADAQFAIARELGFRTWRDLRAHVMAQAAAREAIAQPGPAVDGDMPTLHVRCGSDIQGELAAARFRGDFLALWDSFPVGPVTDAPDWIAQRARFHAETGAVRDV